MIDGHFVSRTTYSLIVFGLFLGPSLPAFSVAQESVRNLENAPRAAKYLTPGEVDAWIFDGKRNETIVVRVSTQEFDPVIGLARVDGESEHVLFSIDDKGSSSQFSYRLKEDGEFKIRVHGFEMKGGGNYELEVQRYQTRALKIGQTMEGKFGRDERVSFFFSAESDDHLLLLTEGSRRNLTLDPKGNAVSHPWSACPMIWTRSKGEYLIQLTGKRGEKYKLEVRSSSRSELALNDKVSIDSTEKSFRVWDIEAKPGDFRMITVTRSGDIESRLIYAPVKLEKAKLLEEEKEFSELQFIPVSSKGDLTRYVVVFGRKGRYQLQSYSHADKSIHLTMTDPTRELNRGDQEVNQIPIGATNFYGFQATAGDLIRVTLDSNAFDTVVRLYDEAGRRVTENDDSRDSKNSQIQHMVTRNGFYRWQVASLGNGGGGDYQIAFDEVPLKQLEMEKSFRSSLFTGSTEYWSLQGSKDQQLYINVQSDDFNPTVSIYGPDGYRYDQNNSGGIGDNSLLAIKLPESGQYTVWVNSQRDGGDYRIRVINASWK